MPCRSVFFSSGGCAHVVESTTAVTVPGPPVHSVRPAGTCIDTVYDAHAPRLLAACEVVDSPQDSTEWTQRSTTVSKTSSTYAWRCERDGGHDGGPSAPLEHGDRSRLRAVMASSEFPGSHGPGTGKHGGGRDLRPSTPSKGEKAKRGLGRPVSNGSRWRWGWPLPSGR